MEPGPARSDAGGNRRDGAFAVPAAGSRGRAMKFVLAAAAGLALASGVMTGTPAAHAAAAVSNRTAAAVHGYPMFQPCPCDKPICRPGCSQSMAVGGPASMVHRQSHLAAAAAVPARAAAAIHVSPMFEPCPCADPPCRPVCFQSVASSGPAAMIHRQSHLAAAATVSARAGAVHAQPMIEPCLCDNPICRPACYQSVAVGGHASAIHRQTQAHLTAAQAVDTSAAVAVNCPPPTAPATTSQDGNPSC